MKRLVLFESQKLKSLSLSLNKIKQNIKNKKRSSNISFKKYFFLSADSAARQTLRSNHSLLGLRIALENFFKYVFTIVLFTCFSYFLLYWCWSIALPLLYYYFFRILSIFNTQIQGEERRSYCHYLMSLSNREWNMWSRPITRFTTS